MTTGNAKRDLAAPLRTNDGIVAPEVLLIAADGSAVGVVGRAEALVQARDSGHDLVEVDPSAVPPVCKLMTAGKAADRAARRSASAQKPETRVIRVRPGAPEADVRMKIWHGREFLAAGGAVEFCADVRGASERRAVADMFEGLVGELAAVGTPHGLPTLREEELVVTILPVESDAVGRGGEKESNPCLR